MPPLKKILKISFIILSIILCLAISFILYETRDEIEAMPENINAKLQECYNSERMAGFSVSVFGADSVYYIGGTGYADKEQQIPYTSSTLQYTASLCKTSIGFCLLKGVELGFFELDDPINAHLPFKVNNPYFPNEPINIRHLAMHTSSLDYNEEVVESLYVDESEKTASMEEFMRDYFERGKYGEVLFTEHLPGTHWNYTNLGSALAAYIIEYKSGQTYDDFCQKHLLQKVGMKHTAWFRERVQQELFSQHYAPVSQAGYELIKSQGVHLYPVRDMITNAQDLTKYAQAMMRQDPNLLSPESYQELLSPALSNEVSGREVDQQGLFWMMDRNQYGVTYSLTGMNGGDSYINTMMWMDNRTGLGYIFLGNTGASKASVGNHIWIFRALVSLGDYIVLHDPQRSFWEKWEHRLYNYYSRLTGLL
ncbi:MAG: serine hydrolase domain-containing protein [Bacteroidota bacterium]